MNKWMPQTLHNLRPSFVRWVSFTKNYLHRTSPRNVLGIWYRRQWLEIGRLECQSWIIRNHFIFLSAGIQTPENWVIWTRGALSSLYAIFFWKKKKFWFKIAMLNIPPVSFWIVGSRFSYSGMLLCLHTTDLLSWTFSTSLCHSQPDLTLT